MAHHRTRFIRESPFRSRKALTFHVGAGAVRARRVSDMLRSVAATRMLSEIVYQVPKDLVWQVSAQESLCLTVHSLHRERRRRLARTTLQNALCSLLTANLRPRSNFRQMVRIRPQNELHCFENSCGRSDSRQECRRLAMLRDGTRSEEHTSE